MKRQLLARLMRGEMASTSCAISRRLSPEPAALAPSQEQLWLFEKNRPASSPPLYNESFTVRMRGPLKVEILNRCLSEIVRRHEIWRTHYSELSGRLTQIINDPPADFPLKVIDLRQLPEGECETEARRLARKQARRPFDLQSGPLLRAVLIRIGDEEYELGMTGHQSIIDGVSVYQIFPRELAQLYRAFEAGRESPLPKLPIQFADFANWQRQFLNGEVFQKQISYWQKQLGGRLSSLGWPKDRPRPTYQTFRGVVEPFAWSREVSRSLRSLRDQQEFTLFTVLAASYVALLHRYTGKKDIILGTLAPAGRNRSEAQGLLGYFLNPVALRFDLSFEMSFRDLLRQTQKVVMEAISHSDVPFEDVVKSLRLQPDSSRNPLFTVAVSLQPPRPAIASDWTVTSMDADNGGSRWDLYVAFIEGQDRLIGRAQYNPDLFLASTIRRMLVDWQCLLEAAAREPQRRLTELPIASAAREIRRSDQLMLKVSVSTNLT